MWQHYPSSFPGNRWWRLLLSLHDYGIGPSAAREVCRVRCEHFCNQCFGSPGGTYCWWSHSREYDLEMDLHYQVCQSSITNTRPDAGNPSDIFHNSVPIAVPAFIIAALAIPNRFPYHGQVSHQSTATTKGHTSKETLQRIDIPGTILVLLAVLGLTAAFEEADKLFPWRSAYVITLLVVSGILWILLILWERHVTLSNGIREPVLPWRFLTNRQMLGILL